MEEQRFNENMGRICRNDKEGLREIYEDYCPLIYSVVEEILHHREDAEDVTSEFLSVSGISLPHTVREKGTEPG